MLNAVWRSIAPLRPIQLPVNKTSSFNSITGVSGISTQALTFTFVHDLTNKMRIVNPNLKFIRGWISFKSHYSKWHEENKFPSVDNYLAIATHVMKHIQR